MLHNVQCRPKLKWESEILSKSRQFNYQNLPCDLAKKMNTHTLCFCPLIRKLRVFENLVGSKKSTEKAEDTQISPVKYNFLYFHGCEIQLFQIYIIF